MNSLILFELLRQIVDVSFVKVIPSKMGIPIGRFGLQDTFPQLEDGDIKSSPPQIEDCNLFILLFFETIGKGSGGWFIDDSNDIQTCYSPRILCGLTLAIIKISWDGNDRIGHFLAEIGLGCLFHFLEDESRDFRGTILLIPRPDPCIPILVFNDFIREDLQVLLNLRVWIFSS